MSIDYYYNSNDRVTISPKHLDNAKSHIDLENKTSKELSYECLIKTDKMSEKTGVQRTLSSRKEALKERFDYPKKGWKIGLDWIAGVLFSRLMDTKVKNFQLILNGIGTPWWKLKGKKDWS